MALKSGQVITQDPFLVAPHLIGLPLAGATRRGVAMLIDLALVGLLVNVGGALFFALAAAYVFFRLSSGRAGSRVSPRLRGVLRTAGTFALFVLALRVWNAAASDDDEKEGDGKPVAAATVTGSSRTLRAEGSGMAALRTLAGSASLVESTSRLEKANDIGQARDAVSGLRRSLGRMNVSDAEQDRVLRGIADESRKPFVAQALREALGSVAGSAAAGTPRPASPDSLALAYAAAFRASDTAGAAALRPRLAEAVAGDTLQELGSEVTRLKGELAESQEETAQAQRALDEVGLLSILGHWADDLGLGFGWTGLYFTAFLALWKGQTPGKRMMGIRVMRLNGAPMTLWASFERFGGYAASIFTGLLGFFQILWDHNRQGMHDKIVETVVIRVIPGLDPVAAPTAGRYETRAASPSPATPG